MNTKNTPLPHSGSSDRELPLDRIADLLTLGTEQLDDKTTAVLQQARATALARQSVTEPVLASATGHWHLFFIHSGRQWMMLILLIAIATVGTGYWQHITHLVDAAHLDMDILTDDMPLEVFLDQ